ncbi:MAG TPA: M20/M25/M40 family metallo-hydrolase [Blastocatellia bacterium]|nr:M20/M25/M40 family metallo-hydrolase [Blastocatellia bacterium]
MRKSLVLALLFVLPWLQTIAAHRRVDNAAELDWAKAGDEAVAVLADYLRVDTTNPPGNESRAAKFFAALLEKEGIAYRVFESAPGRSNLYARIKGSGKKRPLILLNHTDVVPADSRFWSSGPFSGEVRAGYLYGRGAIDMKSLGIAQSMTILLLKRQGVMLDRDVIFLATADEEAGGREGAGWFVRNHPELIRDAEFLLTEGSSNLVLGERVVYYGIGTTEKTPCWLRLTARGAPGHGSVPRRDSAPSRLLRALGRLEAFETPVKVTPAVARYFAAIAELQSDEDSRRAYANVEAAIQDPKLRRLVLSGSQNSALLRNTIQPTVVSIGSKTNVIAPIATAEIDCRLLPGERPEDFVATIKAVVADPTIEVETLLAFPASESPADTELYQAIIGVSRAESPSARFVPTVLAGFTDSHFFRDLGIICYGFSPFMIPQGDYNGVHGNDERMPVESIRRGTKLMYRIVQSLCAGGAGAPASRGMGQE